MNHSADKPETSKADARAPEDQASPDPDAGTPLDMEALDAISAGNDATSFDDGLFRLRNAQALAEQRARDAYRDAHPSVHPDELVRVVSDMHSSVGVQGKSGA